MYRLNGRPVSLYVIPDTGRERGTAEVFGHDAVIWSNANTTYVLVGRVSRETLEALALAMEREL
jgi:anti-sigma factor RsiW